MNGMERYNQLADKLFYERPEEARAQLLSAMERDSGLAAGAFGIAQAVYPWSDEEALRFMGLSAGDLKQNPALRKLWRAVRKDSDSANERPSGPALWDEEPDKRPRRKENKREE